MIALDDNIEDHPKFVALSNDAFALWIRCIGYCRRNLTDGFVPEGTALSRARSKRAKAAIGELLAVSPGCSNPLWHEVPGGYRIHDYLGWNPSKIQVQEKIERNREKGRKGGLVSGAARAAGKPADTSSANQNEASGFDSASTQTEAPRLLSGSTQTNPDPIRSGPVRSGGGVEGDLRAGIRAELEAHPALRDFAHAAGVEALALSAVTSGRRVEAVRDALRHLATKASAGGWSRSRIEGALARAVQFAKLPVAPEGEARALRIAPKSPPPMTLVGDVPDANPIFAIPRKVTDAAS